MLRITSPAAGSVFTISATPDAPTINFATDGTGPHRWEWWITWYVYSTSGRVMTTANTWAAHAELADLGGKMQVTAYAYRKGVLESATVTVEIRGTNPSQTAISTYVKTKPNSNRFDRIIFQESSGVQFGSDGKPLKSFDFGIGICQLTSPAATVAQAWNWKQNIDAGLVLYAVKRIDAIKWLGQSGRTYTTQQLDNEQAAKWNNGHYYEWNGTAKQWLRPNTLCDPGQSNTGWNMDRPNNKGLSLQQLRDRDKQSDRKNPSPGQRFFSPVCYVDHL